MTPQITALNEAYCRLTGNSNTLDLAGFKQSIWYEWLTYSRPPWSFADLELVCNWLKRQIREGKRGFTKSSLRFSRLIDQPDIFEELLSMARAEARQPRETPKQEILRATGRPSSCYHEDGSHTKTPAEIIAGDDALKKLLELRNSL